MLALLAASVLLLPSAASAETIHENASVQSQMDSLIRKSGNPAETSGTMSELTVNTGSAGSGASLPGIVYNAGGQVVGYSSGQGYSRSTSEGSSNPGSTAYGAASGSMSGYVSPVPSAQSPSQPLYVSDGYILNGNGTSGSRDGRVSSSSGESSDRITGPGAKLAGVTLENSVNSGSGSASSA
ncbi:MAG: hypothetical protein J6N50_02520, partial [Bacteroidales bacterium]|nr:hypothetical protein [Bacteroidales bacterium]